ncbi:MAG: hypothetical protein HQK60_01750 [Deltaproteobacteria bacterium]|nr:hypothetical protein [Deltaproteobacteria bacterium]
MPGRFTPLFGGVRFSARNFASVDDALEIPHGGRRNLSDYDRGVMAIKVGKVIQEKAKENQKAGGGDKVSDEARAGCQNSDKAVTRIDTKKELAEIAGISHDTIAKIKKIESTGSEELKQAVRDEKVSIHTASNLDTSQRAMLAVDDEADYAVLAKERQGARTDLEENIPANLPEGDKRQARDDAARDWNVSARSRTEPQNGLPGRLTATSSRLFRRP